jgi:hypothetical protein
MREKEKLLIDKIKLKNCKNNKDNLKKTLNSLKSKPNKINWMISQF